MNLKKGWIFTLIAWLQNELHQWVSNVTMCIWKGGMPKTLTLFPPFSTVVVCSVLCLCTLLANIAVWLGCINVCLLCFHGKSILESIWFFSRCNEQMTSSGQKWQDIRVINFEIESVIEKRTSKSKLFWSASLQ